MGVLTASDGATSVLIDSDHPTAEEPGVGLGARPARVGDGVGASARGVSESCAARLLGATVPSGAIPGSSPRTLRDR